MGLTYIVELFDTLVNVFPQVFILILLHIVRLEEQTQVVEQLLENVLVAL